MTDSGVEDTDNKYEDTDNEYEDNSENKEDYGQTDAKQFRQEIHKPKDNRKAMTDQSLYEVQAGGCEG